MQAREVCNVFTNLLLTLEQLVLLVEHQVQLILQLAHLLLNVDRAQRSRGFRSRAPNLGHNAMSRGWPWMHWRRLGG